MFEIIMSYYRCLGGLRNVISKELHKEIETIVPEIKGRPRLLGYDIEYEGVDCEFYINTYDEEYYQIDISMNKQGDFLSLLKDLRNILIKLECTFDLVYFQEDDEGGQISKDIIFFDNRPNGS